jgi:hypothetical protein
MQAQLQSQTARKLMEAARLETEKRKHEADAKAAEEAERALRPAGTLIDMTV